MKRLVPNPGEIATQMALSNALGRTPPTIRRWMKHPDWKWPRSAPWQESDISDMKAWAFATLNPDRARAGGDGVAMTAAASLAGKAKESQIRLNDERADLVRLQREGLEGELIRVDRVREGRVARIYAVKAAMKVLAEEVSRKAAGMDSAGIKAVIEAECHELCRRFADE